MCSGYTFHRHILRHSSGGLVLEIGLFAAQLAQVLVQKVLVFLADLQAAVHRRRRRDAIDRRPDQPLLLGDGLGQGGVLLSLLVQFRSQLRDLKIVPSNIMLSEL